VLRAIITNIFQNKNQVWTFYAQLARVFSGIAFIVLMVRMLPADLLGTWYIFLAMFGVVSLAEMGLSQVMGRHAAYLKADYDLKLITSRDFLIFTKMGERFYLVFAVFLFLLVVPSGLWWLSIDNEHLPESLVYAWVIYVLGGVFTILSSFYSALVNGCGKMWLTQRATIFSSLVSVMVLLFLFVYPENLVVPAMALLASQLTIIFFVRKHLYSFDITTPVYFSENVVIDKAKIVRQIKSDATKMLLIMISFQLLTSGFVLVISKYLTLAEIASYGITMQLVGIIMSFAMIWTRSNFFLMASHHRVQENLNIEKIFYSGLTRGVLTLLLGMSFILLVVPHVLDMISSKTNLPPSALLATILLVIVVEFSLTQYSHLLIAKNNMSVAYFSLFGGVFICSMAVFVLENDGTLTDVFLARLGLFILVIGLPNLIMTNKLFIKTNNLS